MGLLADVAYFAPLLGPRRTLELIARKTGKRLRTRRLRGALAAPEGGAALAARLGLPAEPAARLALLRERLAETTHLAGAFPGVADPGTVRRAAETVLEGRQRLFGVDCAVGFPVDWTWRGGGNDAVSRDPGPRATWELMRLQGILPLARAARSAHRSATPVAGGEGERFASAYVEAALSFFRRHPVGAGSAWTEALEAGLRALSLCQATALIAPTACFAERHLDLLRELDRTVRWLRAHLSTDKVVPANHLLGELAGLVAAGHLWPGARGAWWGSADPQKLLEREILRQFTPDGVNVEQSVTYQKFILEFLTLAAGYAAVRGRPFADPVGDRLRAGVDYLGRMAAPDGALPRIGDCDSSRGADWGDPDPHDPRGFAAWASGVLGPVGPAPTVTTARSGSLRAVLYPDAGHAVIRGEGGDPYLAVRCGPFGWTRRGPCAHSHADLLSPVLYWGREPVLVDPGVHLYADPGTRDALRSWEAHNAVVFGSGGAPRPAGIFRWRDIPPPGSLRTRTGEGEIALEGRVARGTGRQALIWSRILRYNQLDECWTILDQFSDAARRPVTWAFHFAPGVDLTVDAGPVAVRLPSGRSLELVFDPRGEVWIDSDWVCPGYGRRVAAPVLRRRLDDAASSRIALGRSRAGGEPGPGKAGG